MRTRLPAERYGVTKQFRIGEYRGYVSVNCSDEGTPLEIFITISQSGSQVRGFADAAATMASLALQYGAPLDSIVSKWIGMNFEPSGFTGDEEFPSAKSVLDYVGRWLKARFLREEAGFEEG